MVRRVRATIVSAVLAASCSFDLPPPRVGSDAASDTAAPHDSGCPMGRISCGSACVDSNVDPQHCGDCTTACGSGTHAVPICAAGHCASACETGFVNCDGDPATSGCPIAAAIGCGDCDPAGSTCASAGGVACHVLPASDGGVSRCCRAVTTCSAACGAALMCAHDVDFDLCCAM